MKNGEEDRQDKLTFEGIVDETLPATQFKVKVDGVMDVICMLSGRMRQNKIRVLLGDNVTIETSPYDLTRGRIVRRTT